jgi:hypothetical protein
MLKASFFTDLFGQSYSNSCERFLVEASIPLNSYHEAPATFIQDFFDVCYQNPFFVAMENPSLFVMADEASRCVMRATQDFLYGLKEVACQDCACESTHEAKKAQVVFEMIQRYAHRILSFYNIEQFNAYITPEFAQQYDQLFDDYAQNKQSLDEACHVLAACKGMVDDLLLMQGFIFIRYVDCLKS